MYYTLLPAFFSVRGLFGKLFFFLDYTWYFVNMHVIPIEQTPTNANLHLSYHLEF